MPRRLLKVGVERLTRLFRWARPGTFAAAAIAFPLFFVLSSAILTLIGTRVSGERRGQPIEFNHRIHTEDLGLECTECHGFYESETFSGFPDAEACAFCHEEAQGDSAEEERLVALLAEGNSLDWKPLFRQPPHVFYSHRRHVVVGGIECEACHGSIGTAQRPPRSVEKMDMDACISCHVDAQANNDCTACHR